MGHLAPEDERRLLVDENPVGVVLVAQEGTILDANESFCRFLGRPSAEVIGRDVADFWVPADVEMNLAARRAMLERGNATFSDERRYVRADGEIVYGLVRLRLVDAPDGAPMLLAHLVDVTERRKVEDELRRAQRQDRLTGLGTRELLIETIAQDIGGGRPRAVIVLGLDRFAHVNEGLGPGAGDAVLVTVSRELAKAFSGEHCLTRIGGDEFALLADPVAAEATAERARRLVAEEVMAEITASVGVRSPVAGDSAEDVLRDALLAMHRAKDAGRNRIVAFDNAMRGTISRRIAVVRALRKALAAHTLQVHFQPIWDLKTDMAVGVEALARLHDETLGDVSPAEFIPAAEAHHLIATLGEVVLRQALANAERWPDLEISVNLSPAQLRDDEHVARLCRLLSESGATARRVHLEITESIFLERTTRTDRHLAELRACGVSLWLDDFGTGYASLAALHELPIDGLKIDRSFVSRIGDTARGGPVIRAMLQLAQALSLHVVAEGVEVEEARDLLAALGCQWVQGFLYGKPVPADEIERHLRRSVPRD
jgi:diguanylate cyclase (GGDEF)-like protein/PAS domain S-box-containing protein